MSGLPVAACARAMDWGMVSDSRSHPAQPRQGDQHQRGRSWHSTPIAPADSWIAASVQLMNQGPTGKKGFSPGSFLHPAPPTPSPPAPPPATPARTAAADSRHTAIPAPQTPPPTPTYTPPPPPPGPTSPGAPHLDFEMWV